MSWSVANGSSHSQIGKSSAEMSASPTQPKIHRNSGATARVGRAAGDALGHDPRPADEADARAGRAAGPGRDTRRAARDRSGAARTSRARTNRNDRATVVRRADEVDGERQRALVGGREAVGARDRRRAERRPPPRPGRRAARAPDRRARAASPVRHAARLRRSEVGADAGDEREADADREQDVAHRSTRRRSVSGAGDGRRGDLGSDGAAVAGAALGDGDRKSSSEGLTVGVGRGVGGRRRRGRGLEDGEATGSRAPRGRRRRRTVQRIT